MTAATPPVRVFVGSSVEGQDVATNLQDEIEARDIAEVDLWKHAFAPSEYPLEALLRKASEVDFAVLVASPDDVTVSREVESVSVRDNIILEFGLFTGALGRDRTYLLATGGREMRLPTDVMGLTRLPYRVRSDNDLRAAVNGAVNEIGRAVRRLGPREREELAGSRAPRQAGPTGTQPRGSAARDTPPASDTELEKRYPANSQKARAAAETGLAQELDLLVKNAKSQGWKVTRDSPTVLRLQSQKGGRYAFPKGHPVKMREDLREFAAQLQHDGLRVSSVLLNPVEDSPF